MKWQTKINKNWNARIANPHERVLTDLRCFGVLEALICIIKVRLQKRFDDGTITLSRQNAIKLKLDNMMASAEVQSVEVNGLPGTYMTIKKSDTDSINNIGGFEQFKWYVAGNPVANYQKPECL